MPRLETEIREDGHIILLSVVPPEPKGKFLSLLDYSGKEYTNWSPKKISIFGIRNEHKRQIIGDHPELLARYVQLDATREGDVATYSLVNCVGSVEIADGLAYPVSSFAETMT